MRTGFLNDIGEFPMRPVNKVNNRIIVETLRQTNSLIGDMTITGFLVSHVYE